MMPNRRMKLIRDNLLVRGHVYRAGDVVEVNDQVAKDWLKARAAIDAGDEPVTQPGQPRLRSELIAETAEARGQAMAEKATTRPARKV